MPNSNWNTNNNNNIRTEIINGKVYMVIGNKKIFMRNLAPPKKPVSLNILGPGTYFKNDKKRQNNAVAIVNSTKQNQMNRAKQLAKKGSAYKNIQILSPAYVFSRLRNVGRQSVRNYAALNRNSKNLKGFAIISNSPSRNNRTVNVIATVPGQGTGRLIMQKIIQNAKRNGKTKVTLHAVKTAIPFYEKIGFKRIGNANKYVLMNFNIM